MSESISQETPIPMVDLRLQYQALQPQLHEAFARVHTTAAYVKGAEVTRFEEQLAQFLDVPHVVACGNGTDALQIALMAFMAQGKLQRGDEVITPNFTFFATAEVVALLGLVPILVDVHPRTFNILPECVEKAITPRTRALIPVHLFGQCAPMQELLAIAQQYNLMLIEDNAQALGATCVDSQGNHRYAGTWGHIGTTSFFPSKNLGAYGDGGALFTHDDELAALLRTIANHGMAKRYHHVTLGINSRLDSLQAALLQVKLLHLASYNQKRYEAAQYYTQRIHALGIQHLFIPPEESEYSTHVYHQYTLICATSQLREQARATLAEHHIASAIYYPVPLHAQPAMQRAHARTPGGTQHVEALVDTVLSLPIFPEITKVQQERVLQALVQVSML